MKKLLIIFVIAVFTIFSVTACELNLNVENSLLISDSSGKRSFQFRSDILEEIKKSENKETSKSNAENSKSESSYQTSERVDSKNTSVNSTNSLSVSIESSGGVSEPTVAVYDALVDANVSTNGATVGGVKTYKTVASALDSIGASSGKIIGIKAGTYKEKLTIPANIKNLTLIGESVSNTVLSFGDCSTIAGGTDQSASLTVLADGFSAKNIHFENSYDYLNGSEKDKQALAMYIKADKGVFYNCKFSGHQDTLEVVNGRHYFNNCIISGSVDFIFGNNPSIMFESCEILSRNRNSSNGGYITAMKGNDGTNGSGTTKYGVVFNNCNFTAESGVSAGSVSLGRPWRANATVTFMNSNIGGHVSKKAYSGASSKERYVYMNGGNLKNEPHNANFTEYNNTGSGSITSAVKGCTMLTSSDAKNYTIANVFAKTNGQVTYSTDFNAQTDLDTLKAYNL